MNLQIRHIRERFVHARSGEETQDIQLEQNLVYSILYSNRLVNGDVVKIS